MEQSKLVRASSPPLIVGICGAKQHGKGTIAAGLKTYGFVEVNFADALKRCCAEAFGLPLELFHDNERKELPLTEYGYPNESPRTIAQRVGTELFRAQWPNIWIDTWKAVARRHSRVVVSDLRFPNEMDAVRAMDGYVIRVTRPGYGEHDAHESEAYAKTFVVDYEVVNNGSVADLQWQTLTKVAANFGLM